MQKSSSPIRWSFSAFAAVAAVLLSAGCQAPKSNSTSSAAPAAAAPAPAAAAATAATATSATPAPPVHINAGCTTNVVVNGVTWIPGTPFFDNTDTSDRPDAPITVSDATLPKIIYTTEQYSMTKFTYPVPNGKYTVKLYFAETYDGIGAAGDRVFNFNVCGTDVKNYDVFAKAGGSNKGLVETYPVTVSDKQVVITFTAVTQNPEINGIEILPAP